MNDEYNTDEEDQNPPVEEPKKPRKKRTITPAQRQKMLENLAKGRAKRHEQMKTKKPKEAEVKEPNIIMKNELVEEDTTPKEEAKIEEVVKEEVKEVKKETKSKKKKQKIVLQVDSDSSSDEDCIVIKTKSKKKKQLPQTLARPQLQRSPQLVVAPPTKPELTPQQKARAEKQRKIEQASLGMSSQKFY